MRRPVLYLGIALLSGCAGCSDGEVPTAAAEECLDECLQPEPKQGSLVIGREMQLFLLAGQSNMAGRGVVEAQDTVSHPRIWMLTKAGEWVPARDPVHFDKAAAGVGPGLSFAKALVEADTAIIVGLIPAAVGGTAISTWRPGGYDSATRTRPYDDALARVTKAKEHGELRAILWHQGENDATPELAPRYETALRDMIGQFRTDLGNVPILVAGLGEWPGQTSAWGQVIAAQRAIEDMEGVAFVTAAGLGHRGDRLHFSNEAYRELGRRYAEAWKATGP